MPLSFTDYWAFFKVRGRHFMTGHESQATFLPLLKASLLEVCLGGLLPLVGAYSSMMSCPYRIISIAPWP
jgi:hypothetical protein